MYAANDRREMRHEHEAYFTFCHLRQSLPDLRPVAVALHVVGDEIVRRLGVAEMQFCLASSAAHARLRVGDKMLEIHGTALHERQEAELNGRRIATGICHQPRAGDALAVHFAKAVDRLAHELGRAVPHLVPALPFGDVAQAKIGREVDDPRAALEQRARLVHRYPVGRGEENDVAGAERVGVGLGERELEVAPQPGEHGAH